MSEAVTFKRLYAEAVMNGVPYVLLRATDLKKDPLTKAELALIKKVGAKYTLQKEGHVLLTFNINKALETLNDKDVLNVLERFKAIYELDQRAQLERFKEYIAAQEKGKEVSFSFWAQPRSHGNIAIAGDKGVNSYLIGLDEVLRVLCGNADLVEYDQFYDVTYTTLEDTPEARDALMGAVTLDDKLSSFIVTVVKK